MITNFEKKGNRAFFKRKFLFKILGIIFIIVIFLLILQDIKIYQKKRELVSQINIYKQQIEDIKKGSQTLGEEIANANNKDYLEKLAYEQLGRQRPGEEQIIFINPEEKIDEVSAQNNFLKWPGWFLGAWNWIKSKF